MSRTFALPSPETGTHYRISFAAPDGTNEAPPWPAILFMDGDDQFSAACEAYGQARAAGEVPPLLLVGVGYGGSYRSAKNKRGRDYTPAASELEPESGGAEAFVRFLTRTLWPELARRWPVRDEVRGIAGHSLGSLLAVHALFQSRPFFNRCLASAPSLWWDNRAVLCNARQLRERQGRLPGRLFLGVGTEDSASMTGDLEMFEDQLAAQPFAELEVISRRFPGRNHYDVLPDAFRAGLSALFGEGA